MKKVNGFDCRYSIVLMLSCILLAWGVVGSTSSRAEYGDIVINNFSDEAGMRPAIFPHWFHRIRFRCKVCHADLGFKFEAGGNKIDMLKILDGQYCGACHNGEVAWPIDNCNLCHTGKRGTPTQVHESTLQQLVSPLKDEGEKVKDKKVKDDKGGDDRSEDKK